MAPGSFSYGGTRWRGGGVVGNKSDRAHNMRGTWAVLIQMDQDRYSQLSVKAIIYLSWLGGHS